MASNKSKVGIIGHFGFGLDLANGQTIKTKIVSNVILEVTNNSISFVDAHGGLKAILPVFFGCIKLLATCDNIIIFLTENGLKIAIPTLVFFNKFFHKKLHYNVIGGWLPSFLSKNKHLIPLIKQFDYVYVETNTMKSALIKLRMNNCIVIPNCKKLNILPKEKLASNYTEPFKLCTFSRVMKEKGIEDVVNVVRDINLKAGRIIYSLDIYGQVDPKQSEWFKTLSASFPEYIKYGGVVPFASSVEVLKDYFALVFPTRFFTEGVPGTIVDAYAAGLPIISAKWESFNDVIEENVTGYGFDFCDLDSFEKLLQQISEKPSMIIELKGNCINKAKDYSLDSLKNQLMKYIK